MEIILRSITDFPAAIKDIECDVKLTQWLRVTVITV